MTISDQSRKMLWGKSGNRCAICRIELIMKPEATGRESIVGDECHIVARENNGPRGVSALTPDERNEYENLMLLCKIHHKIIDDQPNVYTVQKLKSLKAEHEKWVRETLSTPNKKADDWVIAYRLETGQGLLQVIIGSHLSTIDNDNLQDTSEVDLVGDFLQNVQDYVDLWSDLESKGRIQAQFELEQELHNLEAMGFLIYGCQRLEKLKWRNISDKFLHLYIFVLRKTNPRVQRNKKVEDLFGIDKGYTGEFAPYLLYKPMVQAKEGIM